MVGLPVRQKEMPRPELLKVYIQLFSSFGLTFTRTKSKLETPSQPTAGMIQYYNLLNSAKAAYFKHVNIVCPLFLESTFEEWHRPPLLMSAIWVCGLSFLPKTELPSKLISSLLTKILKSLGTVHFKPTLSNLQTLLVCLMGGKDFTSFSGVIIGRFELIAPIIFQLGLYKDVPKRKFNKTLIFERQLAFSTVLYLNSGSVYGYGLSSIIFYSQFNWNTGLLEFARQLTSSTKDLGSVISSQCGYLTAIVLSRLQILRNDKNSSFEDVFQTCEFIKRQMYSSIRAMFKNFESFKDNSFGPELSDLKNLFLFSLKARYESMLVYYYQTLYYCASSRSLSQTKTNEYLLLSMFHCMRLIENTSFIPPKLCIYIFLGPCCYSTTWLASNKSYFPEHAAITDSIKLGLSILKRGASYPGIMQSSLILLGLSSCIVKSYSFNKN
ncbi:hypothetical protein DSO57_1011314 [Entomophthora muscae]|uniref:Uncharacterized protein n=1 Tax=Entomophthora muscae TaxID=34485 RepID=A0ACC2T6C1_9FUNG|nr:hypothetical protein DSO57_1011314 [Entomophthora muscae]